MTGCLDSVCLRWAFNRLPTVCVRQGWNGSTDCGLCLGDSLATFQTLCQGARERGKGFCRPDVTAIWTDGHLNLKVNVSEQEIVDMIAVDLHDYDEDDPAEPVDWYGPWDWP